MQRCEPASCLGVRTGSVKSGPVQAEATSVLLAVAGYVQELNMHGELYAALVRTLEEPKSRGQASPQACPQGLRPALAGSQAAVERHTPASSHAAAGGRMPAGSEAQEAQRVGRALRRDMERAGIHLAGSTRARLDALTARTHELGLVFGTLSSHVTFLLCMTCSYPALRVLISLQRAVCSCRSVLPHPTRLTRCARVSRTDVCCGLVMVASLGCAARRRASTVCWVTGQNLADGSRLGRAGLSAREADLVRTSIPSVGPALCGGGVVSGAGASVDLATGPAALHAVLRSVPDEIVRRKVC